ncbi:MAG: hypothetical protein M1824_001281 [Vezdaea acicularis]|nr:MAG: hypothetical protein M1824_001281 [Vezdaea acicularis]
MAELLAQAAQPSKITPEPDAIPELDSNTPGSSSSSSPNEDLFRIPPSETGPAAFAAPDVYDAEEPSHETRRAVEKPVNPLKRPLSEIELPPASSAKRINLTPRQSKTQEAVMRHDKKSTEGVSPWPIEPVQPFSFERLPPEVRRMIYSLLFVRDEIRPICLQARYWEEQKNIHPHNLGPFIPFLRTSHLINQEASAALYGENNFILYGEDIGQDIIDWVHKIGPCNRNAIRNIEMDWCHGYEKHLKKAQELYEVIHDTSQPASLRDDLSVCAHDKIADGCQKIADAVVMFQSNQSLNNLQLIFPNQGNPSHPENFCSLMGCPGCHLKVKEVLIGVRCGGELTMGETDAKQAVVTTASYMGARSVRVTNTECIELSSEEEEDLKREGWSISVPWRQKDSDVYRKILRKVLRGP